MAAQLNHTIVWCRDKHASSAFLADMLGLPAPQPFHHFMVISLDNGVSMDFMSKEGPVSAQHYAFLVDEAGFDHGMARIAALGLQFWADPARTRAGAHPRGRDQPQRRRPRGLLPRSRRPRPRTHHPTLRQRRLKP